MSHRDTNVALHIFTDQEEEQAVKCATRHIILSETLRETPVLVPSTGQIGDCLLALIELALHDLGVSSRRTVPARGPRSLFRDDWTVVELSLPDLPKRRVRIAKTLARGGFWIICDVDAVASTGPFVLDVLARHLHPLDQLRQIGDRERERRTAEVNLGISPGWCLVGGQAATGYLIAATRDVIAAELVALAMSENALRPGIAVTGPWEDPVVQRATELELGVPTPQFITLVIHNEGGDIGPELERIAERIGLSM